MKDHLVVIPDGWPAVTLTVADHLATGGEGAIYLRGDQVFKLYLDPDKAVAAGMEHKIALLSPIRHPGIIAPKGVVRDRSGRFIGIHMGRASGEPLSRLFTTAWRDAHGMDVAHTVRLVESMRAIVLAAHQFGAVMADANELNWLAEKMTEARIIDVDSWQIGGFPATAIMSTIRDYSAGGFSCETDWFAWAVVTFQLWSGVHPYKGIHPDFPRSALAERMKARISVFDPKVRLPPAARPVTDIPGRLRDWYARVFQGDERSAPPSSKESAAVAQTVSRLRIRQTPSGTIKQERIMTLGGPIRGVFGGIAIYEEKGLLRAWDTVRHRPLPDMQDGELRALLEHQAVLAHTPAGLLLARIEAGQVKFRQMETGGGTTILTLNASRMWQAQDRLFALIDHLPNGMLELDVTPYGQRLLATVRTAWPVAALSTRCYRNVLLQDCLGMLFIAVPQGAGLRQARASVLQGYRPLEAFASDPSNVWISAIRLLDGQTVNLHLRMSTDQFELESEELVDQPGLNAAATSAGIGAILVQDRLDVFRGSARRTVANYGVDPHFKLFQMGAAMGAYAETEIIRLRLA